MDKILESRINAMARRDRVTATVFIVATWLVLLFVFWIARGVAPTPSVVIALAVSMLLLGVVNTASVVALIKRYAAEKEHVYAEDIYNLYRNRRRKAGSNPGAER